MSAQILIDLRLTPESVRAIIPLVLLPPKPVAPAAKVGRKRTVPVDFTGVNWKLNDRKIAAQLGCSHNLVGYRRKKLGIPRASMDRFDWASVNWNLSDRAIARQIGCTSRGAGRARKRFGIPPSHARGWSQKKAA